MLLETCQIEVGEYQSNKHEDRSYLQSLMADPTNENLHAKFLDAFEAEVTWVHGKSRYNYYDHSRYPKNYFG
jgi:hypothetical protein